MRLRTAGRNSADDGTAGRVNNKHRLLELCRDVQQAVRSKPRIVGPHRNAKINPFQRSCRKVHKFYRRAVGTRSPNCAAPIDWRYCVILIGRHFDLVRPFSEGRATPHIPGGDVHRLQSLLRLIDHEQSGQPTARLLLSEDQQRSH
jgi:hypothetical protein